MIHRAHRDKQKACKHQFVWRNISLFDLASDGELTLALMIIIRLTWYSLSPSEPTITSLAHCVRTQSVWGASHWIIPGYLLQPLLTNTLNVEIPEEKKKKADGYEHTCTDVCSETCTHRMYELVKHVQGAKRGFAANFPAPKCLVKVKPALLPHLKGSFKNLEGMMHSVSNRKLLMMFCVN